MVKIEANENKAEGFWSLSPQSSPGTTSLVLARSSLRRGLLTKLLELERAKMIWVKLYHDCLPKIAESIPKISTVVELKRLVYVNSDVKISSGFLFLQSTNYHWLLGRFQALARLWSWECLGRPGT